MPWALNQNEEREQRSSHGDEVDALPAKKATQPKTQETRHQHVILEKRKDTNLGRHPADHQQLQEKAEDAGEDKSRVAETPEGIQRKIKRCRPTLECLSPTARRAFPIEVEGVKAGDQTKE